MRCVPIDVLNEILTQSWYGDQFQLREIPEVEINERRTTWGIRVLETSTHDPKSISQAFDTLLKDVEPTCMLLPQVKKGSKIFIKIHLLVSKLSKKFHSTFNNDVALSTAT